MLCLLLDLVASSMPCCNPLHISRNCEKRASSALPLLPECKRNMAGHSRLWCCWLHIFCRVQPHRLRAATVTPCSMALSALMKPPLCAYQLPVAQNPRYRRQTPLPLQHVPHDACHGCCLQAHQIGVQCSAVRHQSVHQTVVAIQSLPM